MFIGNYSNSLDAKYRMIIPSKHREELGLRCVITRGIDRCLYIYPVSEWEVFAAQLSKLPKTDPKARNFVRHMYGSAEECEVDKQGRITIPQRLREYAGIEKDLTTIGNGEKIEVWGREVYEDSDISGIIDGNELAKGMEEYGI